MPIVLGVDPGARGAMALWDGSLLEIADIPTYLVVQGAYNSVRVDTYALFRQLQYYKLYGVELVLVERVGGRKKQNTRNAFNFGFGTGCIHALCAATELIVDTADPQIWKRVMRVPGKAATGPSRRVALQAIEDITRQTFPNHLDQFYTSRKAPRIDRMEAAMMAKYAHDFVYKPDKYIVPTTYAEWCAAYRR